MILPTKRIAAARSMVGVGGQIIRLLDEPKTMSHLWSEIKDRSVATGQYADLTYDWFVLALDFLFAIKVLHINENKLELLKNDSSSF